MALTLWEKCERGRKKDKETISNFLTWKLSSLTLERFLEEVEKLRTWWLEEVLIPCAYKRQDRQGVNLVVKQRILKVEISYIIVVEVNQEMK